MKYEFKQTDYHGSTIVYTLEKDCLLDIIKDFEYFLKGCGFVFDSQQLELVDIPTEEDFDNLSDEEFGVTD